MQNQPLITQQPGCDPEPAITTQPLPPSIPGVPPGLEDLNYMDSLMVHQTKFLIGFQPKNRYTLKNVDEQQCYFAYEESEPCEQQCQGANRAFVVHVVDNFNREVLTIKRESKCCYGCCTCFACIGCCQQECIVETPSMGVLGIIRQRCGFMSSNYDVLDGDGNVIFQIDGPCCCMLCGCQDKEFPIKAANGGQIVGSITKKWGGYCHEEISEDDDFAVKFPDDLDVKLKGVLIGATILIDFMVFEGNPKA